MDCKKALNEVQGDLEKAVDWLRTKGLSAAAKKAGRVAAEGLVGVMANGTKGAVLEVNAETDFVGRNEQFQKFVSSTTKIALENAADLAKIAAAPFPGSSRDVQGELTNLIATIGENMSLRRAASLSVSDGVVAAYTHNAVASDLGRSACWWRWSRGDRPSSRRSPSSSPHVAAAGQSLTVADLDQAAIERERGVLTERPAAGKAADIIPKMVEVGCASSIRRSCCWSRPSSWTARPRSKVVDEAAKLVGHRSASRVSCALNWVRVSRRNPKTLRPRWLHSSRSSMKPGRRVGWVLASPKNVSEAH
jgi:elongation factor Ts